MELFKDVYFYVSDKIFIFVDKTIKLWKVSERDKRIDGYNLKDDAGHLKDPLSVTSLRVPIVKPMELMVEASPRRIFANAHTYHINSISVNSDQETYLSADDLRINLWHLEITDQSFSILLNVLIDCYNLLLALFYSSERDGRNKVGFGQHALFALVPMKAPMIETIISHILAVLQFIDLQKMCLYILNVVHF